MTENEIQWSQRIKKKVQLKSEKRRQRKSEGVFDVFWGFGMGAELEVSEELLSFINCASQNNLSINLVSDTSRTIVQSFTKKKKLIT